MCVALVLALALFVFLIFALFHSRCHTLYWNFLFLILFLLVLLFFLLLCSPLSFFLSGHVLDAVKRWQYFLLRETLGAPARIPSVVCSARKAAWVCACGLEIGTWQGFYVLRDDISGGRTHIIFGIFFLDPWSLFSVV